MALVKLPSSSPLALQPWWGLSCREPDRRIGGLNVRCRAVMSAEKKKKVGQVE